MRYGYFLMLILLYSCQPSVQENKEYKIKVTDFRGKEIKMVAPAKKVICLIESGLSGIYMSQRQEWIIGIPSGVYHQHNVYQYYAKLDERIAQKSLPTPGNWDFVSIEQVVGMKPDLVIIWASQTEAIETLENFDIPVYGVMLKNFDDIYKEIRDLGVLLDAEKRAEELIKTTQLTLTKIKENQQLVNKKSVYFMWSQGITETSGKESVVQELLTTAGVKNACPMDDEHISVSVEKIHDWNPDIIVMWYNEKLDPKDIIENPLLKGIKAVENKQVYELPESFECDFWTLKMNYPAQLIHHWAYGGDKIDFKEIFYQLYGKKLSNE